MGCGSSSYKGSVTQHGREKYPTNPLVSNKMSDLCLVNVVMVVPLSVVFLPEKMTRFEPFVWLSPGAVQLGFIIQLLLKKKIN